MDGRAGSPITVPHHRLPAGHFAALCAGLGDGAVVRALWNTQRSRRLLLTHAVLQTAHTHPEVLGPLPSAASAREALELAESSAPAAVDRVLLHPQVGNWAAYTLRRFRGGAGGADPAWVDFGGIHTLALVAAARGGLPWRTRVPARHGAVMLPGLGMARMGDASTCVPVEAWTDGGRIGLRYADRTVTVPADPEREVPGWWPLRRLRFGTGPVLEVMLDDLDPFRDLGDPVPADRLDDAELARWTAQLAQAWRVLCRHHPDTAEALAEAVVSVVPLAGADGWETRSASTGEAFGSVLVSPPSDPVTLAACLVHEFQHIKLGGLMHLKALTVEDTRRYYAPWRDDPRPLGGLLQGVYAFVGIAGFWRVHRSTVDGVDARLAEFEYALSRAQALEGARVAAASGGLTEPGTRLVGTLLRRIEPWRSEPVPALCADAAHLVTAAHRAGWRIRHIRPSAVEVDGLAYAFRAGRAARLGGYETQPLPAGPVRWSLGMLALVRGWLATAETRLTDRLRAYHLDEADAALVRGDTMAARTGYLRRLDADPDDLNAWVGLGLAGTDPAAGRALGARPELVLAVHRTLRMLHHGPDPLELATWLGRALGEPV